jgi:hypothetical protein
MRFLKHWFWLVVIGGGVMGAFLSIMWVAMVLPWYYTIGMLAFVGSLAVACVTYPDKED